MNAQQSLQQQASDYDRVAEAIRFIEQNFRDQPSLDAIAGAMHLSKYHFQRLFKRWAGVSPTQFMHYLTVDFAKERLQQSESVLDAAFEAGLSSPSRLHDLFVTFEAVTPGEFKSAGEGLAIAYGVHATPFGPCLLAQTERGVCALRFLEDASSLEHVLDELEGEWPGATFRLLPEATGPVVQRLFAPAWGEERRPLPLLLKGTNFQIQVWRALLAIPPGLLASYESVARGIGRPAATRAVSSAIARNPLGYLIPCHRVISKSGRSHNYRWGSERKRAMLGWEAAHLHMDRESAPGRHLPATQSVL